MGKVINVCDKIENYYENYYDFFYSEFCGRQQKHK